MGPIRGTPGVGVHVPHIFILVGEVERDRHVADDVVALA